MNVRLPVWFMAVVLSGTCLAGLALGRLLFWPQHEEPGLEQAQSTQVDPNKVDPALAALDQRFDRIQGLRRSEQIEHLRHTSIGEDTIEGLLTRLAAQARQEDGVSFVSGQAEMVPLPGEAKYRLYVVITARTATRRVQDFSTWDVDAFLMTAEPHNDLARAIATGNLQAVHKAIDGS